MTAYRITGRDSGQPSLPDSALAGAAFGATVDLTLDPAVEAALIDAGLIEIVGSGATSVVSADIDEIVVVTQAAYDLLTPDAATLYVING